MKFLVIEEQEIRDFKSGRNSKIDDYHFPLAHIH